MPRRRPRILIVEDDSTLRGFYRSVLTIEGFDVASVADGYAALQQIDADPPDLIVLDLDLPLVSGRSVQQEVAAHAETAAIPIVVVTGTEVPTVQPSDVACLLRKPVDAQVLVETVRRCLRG